MYKYIKPIALIAIIISSVSCNRGESVKVERRDIIDAVFANGHIFYEDEYLITSNTDGYLKETYKKESEKVRVNEPLFYISNDAQLSQENIAELNFNDAITKASESSSVLAQKSAQIHFATEQYRKDSIDYDRNTRLYNSKAISKVELENSRLQLESSKSNLNIQQKSYAEAIENLRLSSCSAKKRLDIEKSNTNYNTLYCDIDGVVAQINKQNGELVRRGEIVGKVVGGEVRLKLFIAEEEIDRISIGQEVVVVLNSNLDEKLNAQITKIYPMFDIQNQSFIAEAKFCETPKNCYLFSQTQLQANIIVAKSNNALVIPATYLIDGDKAHITGERKLKSVIIGIRNENWVEIVSGVKENEILSIPKRKRL